MSDPIQVVPSAVAVPRAAPSVHPEPPVEPAKKSQAENWESSARRDAERGAGSASERRLSITRDENLKAFIYRSIEEESGEIVWQWPAEEMLRRAEHLRQLEEKARETPANGVDKRA